MKPHRLARTVISRERIRKRVDELAREIAAAHPGGILLLVGILRGSFMFVADLMRALHRHGVCASVDFMQLESYGAGTESSGRVRVVRDLGLPVAGRRVLVVDDILDSGRTLDFAARHLRAQGAEHVALCALLDKPSRRVVPVNADYTGFEIPDTFVVGYGLDYDHHHRELPYLAEISFARPRRRRPPASRVTRRRQPG